MNGKIKFSTTLTILFCFISTGLVVQTFAGTATKTFDFGPGGDNPTFRAHARTFAPPEKVAIVIAVSYRTAGETPFPLIVEIEDATNRVISLREISAEKTAKRVVINIAAGDNTVHGCEKAWNVRVRSRSGEIPPARVFGEITFSFVDPTANAVEVEGQSISLGKGQQTTKNIGNNNSFDHPGVMTVQGSWLHSLANLMLPLKFELVRPDNSTAKTLIGYAMNSNGNPRLSFSHTISAAEAKQNGVWKLRISNATEHEIIEIKATVNFIKKCFE